MSHPSDPLDLAELQLERELRQMFELDSQKDLETYLSCVDNLEPETWAADIQKMYRAIHTIKGGSVTVKANAILDVATVLEDLLSELRYLEEIPSSADDKLQQMLLEGGEIIASVLGDRDRDVRSKVERIRVLQQQIQENYLQDWNEQAQIQIEFAEQGFDLVVLDLEIALNNLSETEQVPAATIKQATELLEELAEIGRELELKLGWQTLLQEASQLLDESDAQLWKTQWQDYFRRLKASAKQGGKQRDGDTEIHSADVANLEEIDSLLDKIGSAENENLESETEVSPSDAWDLGEIDSLLDKMDSRDEELEPKTEVSPSDARDEADIKNLLDMMDLSQDNDIEPEIHSESKIEPATSSLSPAKIDSQSDKPDSLRDIQIPIPLSRLDKSAGSIVDSLLAARTVEHFYQDLHQDLLKLVNLAKDNVQYITQLRQIQDDYALLENLGRNAPQNSQSPTPERYRKGYMTINRLLENSLRLSELGTEAEQTAQKTANKLEKLSSHITNLKDVVEDSRLIPFKNLSFRVRAILRDLINRYDKPVTLEVVGEQIELDVGTTRRLEPILLHMVRNAFDHGLEPTLERIERGKPEQGTLRLSLQRYGSSYVLAIQDDGRGIDPHKVQAKAQQLKFAQTRTDTARELLSVICQPGFSSQNEVSEVSGRGVGMDVVAEQISLLNGSLSLETTPGKGTTFKIDFPVPHLLVPCLLLQAGDRSFAIPTDRVVMTDLWENLAAIKTQNQVRYTWEITQDGETLPGLDLLGYWYSRFHGRSLKEGNVGIYVRLQPQQSGIWLFADKLIGKSELKIQPLPNPLIAPNGIMGVSLQADGSLLPVLELSSLMEYLVSDPETTNTISTGDRDASLTEEESQTILIVDDAALIRRRIEASLSAYGYTTHICSDGLSAWNWLQVNPHPKLMITDIEMPNLDGFTLIDRCRQNNWDFPIIVISSRLAEEWGQEARRLGGTDFLTKGFSTSELLSKVQQYYQLGTTK